MWANCDSSLEPIELRELKQKLAKLSCKCLKSKTPAVSPTINEPIDKEVQAGEKHNAPFDRFTQVNPQTINEDHNTFLYSLSKDVLCPSCFVTMNLLRGGVLKVLKDEESETKNEMFSCDKSTEKFVKAVEKTTSVTNKPVPKFSNLNLCDYMSEFSRDISVHNNDPKHKVKFADVPILETRPFIGSCFCMENYIDSIRPPIDGNNT